LFYDYSIGKSGNSSPAAAANDTRLSSPGMTKKSKGYTNMPTYEPTEDNSGSAHGILVQSVKEKDLSSDLSPSSGSGLQKLTIDEAIDGIPIGFFHFRLLALCGSSFLADAAEVNLLAFVSVCAGVEWDLTTAQIASITSSVFVGQFFGGLFWGPVADYIGRKRAFQLVVAIISVCGFCSAFSTSYYMLIVLRMMAGFGIGGLTVPFDLLAEFVPANRRGEYLMKMEYFWTLGSLFVSAAAWLMLGKYGWRSLTMLNSTPTLIVSLIGAFLLPESPRWLMEAGRTYSVLYSSSLFLFVVLLPACVL
jgi:MFS family permease